MHPDNLVLLIEDNEDFQDLYGMLATAAGYIVESILDGQAALERLERPPIPSLVLLDSFLPSADGPTILAAARSRPEWQNVPIYMLTADFRVSSRYQNVGPGAPAPDGIIYKGHDSIPQLRALFARYKK